MASWFETWFDTKYYHLLYKNRDQKEASFFISKLVDELKLENGSKVVDLCCGKGRHSIQLNELGYDVLGVDLSPQSIGQAKVHENQTLHFQVHDMRDPIDQVKADAVLNLFTSFGYFESLEENGKVLASIHSYLKDDGLLLIDFMNPNYVIDHMVSEEIKELEGIQFCISRYLEEGQIVKRISFSDQGQNFEFFEKVQALDFDIFKRLLGEAGFKIEKVFGNYSLESYHEINSERLILLARKIA